MSKYNEELVTTYVEKSLGKFINEHQDCLNTTVGETILIIQATSSYIEDLLQGITSREQRSLVVDSSLEHTKMLMLAKVGRKYEETKISEENNEHHGVTRQVGKKSRKN